MTAMAARGRSWGFHLVKQGLLDIPVLYLSSPHVRNQG